MNWFTQKWYQHRRLICKVFPHSRIDFSDGSGWWYCRNCFTTANKNGEDHPLMKRPKVPASWKEVN